MWILSSIGHIHISYDDCIVQLDNFIQGFIWLNIMGVQIANHFTSANFPLPQRPTQRVICQMKYVYGFILGC